MEYEKSEINSAEERAKLLLSQREFIEQRVKKVIELKKKLCNNGGKSFILINQKGIDVMSLDMLAKKSNIALRRAKRRNMERLACGRVAMNHLDDIPESQLDYAGLVYEYVLRKKGEVNVHGGMQESTIGYHFDGWAQQAYPTSNQRRH